MNGVGVVGKEENAAGLLENALKGVGGVVGKAGKAVGLLEKDVGDVGKEGKNRGLLAKGTKGVAVVGNPENPVGLFENAAKGVVGKEENAVGLLEKAAKGEGVVAKAGGVVAKAGAVGCRRRKTVGGVAVLKVGGRAVVSNNLQKKVCLYDIFFTFVRHLRQNFSVLARIFKDLNTLRKISFFPRL